ncbi:MAG: ion channel [Vicinamibacterales bacterium]
MADVDFTVSPLAPRRTADEETIDRDLGFGAVVSRQRKQRLLNPNGSFNVSRSGLGWLEMLAPYQQLLTISWPGYLGVAVGIYFIVNLLFALAYLAAGPESLVGGDTAMAGGPFARAFFFSVQTFATIGYGQIGPHGLPANLLVTLEALVGLIFQALATGLLFARFSRPTASIIFSRHAVIAPYRDGLSFQFRIANRRRSELLQLEAQVLFSAMEPDGRGGTVRRYAALPLERNRVTFFPLSWTIVHPIDDSSPFAKRTLQALIDAEAEILVLLSGTDDTYSQTVHSRSSYRADEIRWNARFSSMFVTPNGPTPLTVDISRLHDYEHV